ncbi:MAG: HPr family phosphocarrier protein [bacterium]
MTKIDIKDITAVELRAIQDHKYFMSQKNGKEVTIEEAIVDFLDKYMDEWKLEKIRHDNMQQVVKIKEYIAKGGEVEEWTEKYAPVWRQERESLENNDFDRRVITITNENGLHVRPSSKLVAIAKKHDCELYLHREGMEHYNFKLNGKSFMNVKTVLAALDLVSMCVGQGEQLEFIAYGKQAKETLDEIELIVQKKFGEKS